MQSSSSHVVLRAATELHNRSSDAALIRSNEQLLETEQGRYKERPPQ
jgi:hypothetical protein